MIALATTATVLIVLGAGCAALVSHMNINLGFDPTPREHLQPIPVSQTVCPYVRVMHAAANSFQEVNPVGNLSFVGRPIADWPKQRAELARSLHTLNTAVVAGQPRFPAPIRRRLAAVVTSIRKGEVELVRAHNVFDLATRTTDDFANAQVSFGEASDLVGHACGVYLAADPQPVGRS